MRASESAFELIREFEGLRLEAYKCPAGVWTIGYGHTKNVKEGQRITLSDAKVLLLADITECEQDLSKLLRMEITQNQFDALISFIFNLGAGKLKTSTLLKLVNANHNDPNIRNQFLKWKYAGGVVQNGLLRRREEESNLYFKK